MIDFATIDRLERRGDVTAALAAALLAERHGLRSEDRMVRLLLRTQHFDEAEDLARRSRDATLLLRRASATRALVQWDFERAITEWQAIARSTGELFDVRVLLRALAAAGRYDDVIRTHASFPALHASPEIAGTFMVAQAETGARSHLEVARELEAMMGESDRSLALVDCRALSLERAGDLEGALAVWLRGLELGGYEYAHNVHGIALRTGQAAQAIRALSDALAGPLPAKYRALYRFFRAQLEPSHDSARELVESLRIEPGFAAGWRALALASDDPVLARDAAEVARRRGVKDDERLDELAAQSCRPVSFDELVADVHRWESQAGKGFAYRLASVRAERTDDPRARVVVANLALSAGDLEIAARLIAESAGSALDREHAKMRARASAMVAAQRGDRERGVSELERIAAADPEDIATLVLCAIWREGLGHALEARAHHRRLFELGRTLDPRLVAVTAHSLALQGGSAGVANDLAELAYRRAPDDVHVRSDRADIALMTDDVRRGLEVIGTAPPEAAPKRWYDVALMAVAANDRDEDADRLTIEATERFPSAASFLRGATLAFARRGEPERGLEAGRRAVALDPDSTLGWSMLASVAFAAGDRPTAIGAMQRALSMSPLPTLENDALEMFVEARDDRR